MYETVYSHMAGDLFFIFYRALSVENTLWLIATLAPER